MVRLFVAFAAAVLVAAILGSVAQTQFNLAFIAQLGVEVPLAVRLESTVADLVGFAPLYAAAVAVAFAIAFSLTELVARRMAWRGSLFAIAGGAAIAVAILLANAALPMTPVAATRVVSGIAVLALAGAVGGWVYHALRGTPAPRSGTFPGTA